MGISKAIHIAMQEEIPNPYGTCNACERSGLPILLLREAYAPNPRDTTSYLVAHGSEITHVPMLNNQLRTLRQGYVYVLLDQEIWQAYQVTPEGALRRFPVSQPPLAPGRSLAQVCRTQNHDVIASFININTALYQKAWIAFANDPWPRDVLDRYREGIANQRPDFIDRFVELDLNTARNDPASVGIAMTESDLGLGEVLEYAAAYPGKFTSAHGFYPRMSRLPATRNFVRTTVLNEQLPNGVLALTVPDPVGLVMEANAQRTLWFQRMQEWRAEPQRHFEYFTSQALLGIRELNEARAAAQAVEDTAEEVRQREQWNNSAIRFKAPRPAVDVEAHAQRTTERKQQEARERLEERYDEKARAAFQAGYDREVKHWQTMIDKVGELYAIHYGHRSFQRIGYFDYSATSPLSVNYFIKMLSACLAGGPTERLPEEDAPLGPTQYLWQQLLEDPNSLLYQALTAKNQSLRQQLVKALSSNDLTQVYHAVKAIATSSEGERLMIEPVQDAIGQLLAATASGGNALGARITERTRALIGHVHSTAFLLYAGQPITQVRLSLTLGEYMSLLNEALQERTDAFLGQLDKHFRRPAGRKVRAMVLSGAIHLAAAGNRSQMVEVMIWTLESAERLQAKLTQLRDSAAEGAGALVRNASIGADTLRLNMRSAADDLKIGAAAARTVAGDGLRSLRTAASSPGSANMLLALGGLWFQQDSLIRNIDALRQSSVGNPETLAAVWSSSLGLLGASVESTGFSLGLVQHKVPLAGMPISLSLGEKIARVGGALVAIAGLLDAVQYYLAAKRAGRQDDEESVLAYGFSSAAMVLGAYYGVRAALGSASLFGPLGLAIILVAVAYGFAAWAKSKESSPLELWAKGTRWGLPLSGRRWGESIDYDAAVAALNVAVVGMEAKAGIEISVDHDQRSRMSEPGGTILLGDTSVAYSYTLAYSMSLPGYYKDASRYEWELVIQHARTNGEAVVLTGGSARPFEGQASGCIGFLDSIEANAPRVNLNDETATLNVEGVHLLKENHSIGSFELTLHYWPDAADESGCACLIIKEDKISSLREAF
ncbi:hypothetical protein E6B08_12180 [Pseudomonas putida]|uniref:Toxin VasX N-terminal region domain-containing protein n=1 Tax=Pseudomonas putida TaxID=303 RepID=A0A4D6XBR4_PSEPU|nr:T6SS effector BTH_I2691 family protein [Pseudomonas putida]QCI12068.1 hypothetical protein E6B08_12180 [Pseudomonas putida]